MECDDQFMKDICKGVELAPIWLLDDFSQATPKAVVNHTGIKGRVSLNGTYERIKRNSDTVPLSEHFTIGY